MLENLHSTMQRLNFLTRSAPGPEHIDSTDTYTNKCTRLHDLRLKRSLSDGIKTHYERATSAQIWTETKKLVIPLSKSKVSLRSSFVNLACLFIYFFWRFLTKKVDWRVVWLQNYARALFLITISGQKNHSPKQGNFWKILK